MMARPRQLVAGPLLAAALVVAAAPAGAASLRDSPKLWATVNVCDTVKHPDVLGIRASMPAANRREALQMRFQVEFRTQDGSWEPVAEDADSGWQQLGTTRNRVVESGWNFRFQPPASGASFVLRGVVIFRWLRAGRVVRRAQERTERGHRSTRGADPPNYSAATCRIT
jgi:hypothetical protein